MQYIQQSITHGHKKLKQAVYEHSIKATFYHPQILERNETIPKLRQLHGCRDWMHAVHNTGVPGVVEWRDFDCCCVGCLTHTSDCSNKHVADSWQRHSLTTHTIKELRELDFSHWMPSFVKIKGRDVDGKNASTDDELLSSDESVFELLDSKDPDESSDDDAKSLSPEEIVVSSDEAEVEEKMLNTTQPVDSDVSISSDAMEFLQETSSESDEEDNQPLNYEEKLKKYHSYKHYTCLKGHIMRKRLPSPVTSIKEIFRDADTVDEVAKSFYPSDGPVGYLPIVMGSDGNCLPRALSHLFFGNEDHHFEVRCRIIEAGVLNENDFISHQILTWGVTNGSRNRPWQYATYSPKLQPTHRRLDCDEILDVYQQELMALTINFEFMGI